MAKKAKPQKKATTARLAPDLRAHYRTMRKYKQVQLWRITACLAYLTNALAEGEHLPALATVSIRRAVQVLRIARRCCSNERWGR
jgi:hypothetical protein